MPAGAHHTLHCMQLKADEAAREPAQQQQQLGREQRFLSPGSGDLRFSSHLLRTFLSHPRSGHVAVRLLVLRSWHLFYFYLLAPP
jgi:hypothetical protein